MKLAEQIGGKQGLQLEPEDPIRAQNIDQLMKDFNKLTPAFFEVIMTRGKDESLID